MESEALNVVKSIQKNPMLIMEQLNKLVSENSVDTMEFIDDLKEFRLFNEMIKNKDVKKLYDSLTSNFYISNGLFNRIDLKALNDEQKTFLSLITLQDYTPTNRFRQHILKYYYDNINEPIENLNLKYIKKAFPKNYYSGVPGISADLEKLKIEQPKIKELQHFENYIQLFIKLGESMQFDVQGFPKNQLLYLIFGICIASTFNKVRDFASSEGDNKIGDFKTFKELINYIISIIQINLLNKVFLSEDVEGAEDSWSLVTFLDFKEKDKLKHNFRYQCAKKYINEVGSVCNARNCFTKLIDDDKGTYLSTTYKIKDLKTLWDKFEELYKNKQFDELIVLWFDSQILTRSTCLIGCMLISVLNGKLIKFKHNEMPDWKSIIVGNFKDTYEEIEDLKKIIPETIKDLKLCDILNCLRCYINLVIAGTS